MLLFEQLQASLPHLLRYVRRLEFYSPYRQEHPSPATRALLEFFAKLSLQLPVRVETLACLGHATWDAYLTGLSERLPCVRQLRIQQIATTIMPIGALSNLVALDVGFDAFARFPRKVDPDDDKAPTQALKRLTVRTLSFGALWYLGYYIATIHKRAPLLERIDVIEELENDLLEEYCITDFVNSTSQTRHLIQSMELKVVYWRTIAPHTFHAMLRHCTRLRRLRFVVSLARIQRDALPPLSELPYLQTLEIAFSDVAGGDGLSEILPAFCDWSALEAALLSNTRFTCLSVTLAVRPEDAVRGKTALAGLATLVPALHQRGMLHDEIEDRLEREE
ncbi:hypothetical protein AURDEDRAFT_116947 [Auricularia subglabra TFB-10046 SS5]|uniref:F-box domain-containing protein n=1 Tax=Auricularia subglabra (strain TFB-10046 / SS5) TaxID=717982 RepID=J0LGT2_AURST|nr:hypothetical protein AURDEDRAFT_116947 [Auricularia subglabra TFB-10046 SS5]